MTQVTVKIREDITIDIVGHSGYSVSGADIVCSAVSILSHAFAETCYALDGRNKVKVKEYKASDGMYHIRVEDLKGVLEYPLLMLRKGIYALSYNYPNNVCVVWGEK